MAEVAQLRGLEAEGSDQCDERVYERHGPCATVARCSRADPIVHQYDGPRRDVVPYAGEHLLRLVSPPVLGVRGPSDEPEAVSFGDFLGRRCDQSPGGTPVWCGLSERGQPR